MMTSRRWWVVGPGGLRGLGGGLHNAEAGVGNHSICEKSLCQPL